MTDTITIQSAFILRPETPGIMSGIQGGNLSKSFFLSAPVKEVHSSSPLDSLDFQIYKTMGLWFTFHIDMYYTRKVMPMFLIFSTRWSICVVESFMAFESAETAAYTKLRIRISDIRSMRCSSSIMILK